MSDFTIKTNDSNINIITKTTGSNIVKTELATPIVVTVVQQGPAGSVSNPSSYVHTQSDASASWSIVHNLNMYPSVTVVDTANSVVYGDVEYIDKNVVMIKFSAPFSGKAYFS